MEGSLDTSTPSHSPAHQSLIHLQDSSAAHWSSPVGRSVCAARSSSTLERSVGREDSDDSTGDSPTYRASSIHSLGSRERCGHKEPSTPGADMNSSGPVGNRALCSVTNFDAHFALTDGEVEPKRVGESAMLDGRLSYSPVSHAKQDSQWNSGQRTPLKGVSNNNAARRLESRHTHSRVDSIAGTLDQRPERPIPSTTVRSPVSPCKQFPNSATVSYISSDDGGVDFEDYCINSLGTAGSCGGLGSVGFGSYNSLHSLTSDVLSSCGSGRDDDQDVMTDVEAAYLDLVLHGFGADSPSASDPLMGGRQSTADTSFQSFGSDAETSSGTSVPARSTEGASTVTTRWGKLRASTSRVAHKYTFLAASYASHVGGLLGLTTAVRLAASALLWVAGFLFYRLPFMYSRGELFLRLVLLTTTLPHLAWCRSVLQKATLAAYYLLQAGRHDALGLRNGRFIFVPTTKLPARTTSTDSVSSCGRRMRRRRPVRKADSVSSPLQTKIARYTASTSWLVAVILWTDISAAPTQAERYVVRKYVEGKCTLPQAHQLMWRAHPYAHTDDSGTSRSLLELATSHARLTLLCLAHELAHGDEQPGL